LEILEKLGKQKIGLRFFHSQKILIVHIIIILILLKKKDSFFGVGFLILLY